MTVSDGISSVPAGWYPDPADAARFRRWDGQNWTSDVAAAQPSPPVSVPSAPVFAEPTPRDEPQQAQQQPVHAAPTAERLQPSVAVPQQAQYAPMSAQPASQSMPTAPSAPPSPPPPPVAPTLNAEPQSGPISIPDWANLPGLTLPPDLSSIPGLGNNAVLPLPKFDDGARVSPAFAQMQQPQTPWPPSQQPAPSGRRALRGLRSDDDEPQPPLEPAAPYAPPPSGAQYSAPAPHGVVYSPPPPGTALPASALGMPPMSALAVDPGKFDSPMVTPRYDEPAVGARFNTRSPALSSAAEYVPMARAAGVTLGITEATGTSTVGEWLIAVLPVIHFAVVYVVFGVLAEPVVPGIQWGILMAPAVLSLIFASVDRRKLINNGYGTVPSVVFAVVPPLYLLVRCFSIGWKSVTSLIVWVVLQAAAVAGVFLLLDPVLKAVIAGG